MSKLLQQIQEIQRKYHVCHKCGGRCSTRELREDGVRMVTRMVDVPCSTCKGTGEVEAPDIDKLCKALEVFINLVDEIEEQAWLIHEYGDLGLCDAVRNAYTLRDKGIRR